MPGNFVNNYFGFNKQQRNGLLVLVLISFALLLVRLIYPHFIVPDKITILNLPLIEHQLDSGYTASSRSSKNKFKEKEPGGQLFVFDPNTVSYEQLVQLGFKEKTAQTFLKFRTKGFIFKRKEDLKKIYSISDKLYSRLEPYIVITPGKNVEMRPLEKEDGNKNPSAQTVELNSADSLQLMALNGIGATFAKRVLKYRTILGGFISVEQLKEVYGFTPELFDKIKEHVSVSPATVKKIDLNKDDFKVINKHPYLSFEITKIIFNQRRKTALTPGNLKALLNDDALYQKLLPYITLE
jgi:competence protein ComEA